MADIFQKQSQAVTKNGLWNSHAVNYSKETQYLLKELMKESKLSMLQRKQLDQRVKDGNSLPLVTSSKKSLPEKKEEIASSKAFSFSRSHSGGLRSREQIERSGAYDRPTYRPCPRRGRSEQDKDKFINLMAYGKDNPPVMKDKPLPPQDKPEDKEIDRFDELTNEIKERQQFLDEMTTIGRGGEYRQMINTEISQKVREMELIDRKCSEQLDRLIQHHDTRAFHQIPKFYDT